jgi:DNA-binding LacI/PurR family transcriptional regulator
MRISTSIQLSPNPPNRKSPMTSNQAPQRLTQRRIAELAEVSQATVSLVLNGKADTASRIPADTRDRVLRVIRETGYTADPAARRLAGVGNKIIGVFTYEPAFPTGSQDFYTPLLTGIEAEAESLGCDLLMYTSAPVVNGHRRLLHENNRLRLADGCLLLGLEMDGTELARLVDDGYPFVAVGRREAPGVPYVGLDYVNGTAALVRDALALGHESFSYLHVTGTGESVIDRQKGFEQGLAQSATAESTMRAISADDTANDLARAWHEVRKNGSTAVFVENPAHAHMLYDLARSDGFDVPRDLSIVLLADPPRTVAGDVDFTRLSPPRTRLGAESLRLLSRILDPADEPERDELQSLIDCSIVRGTTMARPPAGKR